MLEFGACPLCKSDISPERKKLSPVVCDHCGFTVSNSSDIKKNLEKESIKWMFGIALFLSACYIQIANWDSAWLEIIPLSLKETVGMATQANHDRKAEICFTLNKFDCTEDQYIKSAQMNPALWERAGHFQMQRAKWNESAQSYYKFLQNGGNNLDAQYNYAKVLSQLGQVDDASKYFDQVLAARPDVLQITVVHNYVKLLVDHQRYEQAVALIEKVRKDGGPSAGSFMEDEFKKIHDMKNTASRE
jgi:tetratricopeptide (TPR) repeat protein